MIFLSTLGSLHLGGDDGPLLPGRRKILALLACILRRSPASLPRADLALLLWPDRSDTHAKQSLRQALAELRGVLGEALETDGDTVRIAPEACGFDVRAFEESVRLERWEEAAAVWCGEFLHGLDGVGGDEWRRWLATERATLCAQAARVFESLLAVSERREERRAAADWAHKWCDVAQLDEKACAARIRALVRVGRPVDAAVCYESFVRRVHAERHEVPSAEFEALRQTFAANRMAPADKVVVRGTVTLSGLAQLSVDARSVAEAAAVAAGPVGGATLQAVSGITSFSFRAAIAELEEHGILRAVDGADARWAFSTAENRERVHRVISADRRLALQRAIAARNGTPAATAVVPPRRRVPSIPFSLPFRVSTLAGAAVAIVALVAGVNWAARVATASSVELEPGSTVLLAEASDATDPALAGALNAAAALGLRQSRHVALYTPASPSRAADAAREGGAEQLRSLARREGIPRIIALDIRRTDSVLLVAARLIDGSSGAVLGEETVETGRARLVDDMDRLLRRVRVTLGEAEEVVRDSSRPLRVVASPSFEALSAYAAGVEAWGAARPEEARTAWAHALELDSTFALAELALASDAFGRDDTAAGERWARRAVAHANRLTALDALRARQMVAQRDGRLDEASQLALAIAERAPSAQAWFDLASVRWAAGQCADAQRALERALALDSAHVRARFLVAECAVQQGNATLALQALDAVTRLAPDAGKGPAFDRYRGMALVRAGRPRDAEGAFRGMLAGGGRTGDSVAALRWLAQLAMLGGRYGEALPHLQEATRLARRAGDVNELFASLVLETGAFIAIGGRTRASELIDEAYAIANARGVPAAGFFQLGHLMARIGRINGAREALRVAALRATEDSEADDWAVRLLTASVLLVERNGAAALEAIDRPEAPPALEPYRLALTADASAMAGQHDAALAAARQLAQAWHFGTDAQDEWLRATLRIARFSEAAGDTAGAVTAYRRYVDRWKEADVYLVELSLAERNLVRLGGGTVATR